MARFVKGDVVVVPFPFSDLTIAKRRPTLVIANNVRPNHIFTADRHIIRYLVGHLKSVKVTEVIDNISEIVRQ